MAGTQRERSGLLILRPNNLIQILTGSRPRHVIIASATVRAIKKRLRHQKSSVGQKVGQK